MLIHDDNRRLESSLKLEKTSFKINGSAKAFQILSSKMYSNPIRAIIRELSCNAYDSHIEAGSFKSFDVHLPNAFDSSIKIRDYGTGLSRHDVENLYTTYFDSTKEQSNEYVGAFGLGSKTPFSYTDAFTVISYHEHKKMVFNCFIGDTGIPDIVHINTSITDEPNGLDISFPVKKDDYDRFELEAEYVFKTFSHDTIKPNCDSISSLDRNYKTKHNDYNILEYNYTRSGNRFWAVQGNVLYPINANFVDGLADKFHFISYRPDTIELIFDIGDLSVSPSREELHYDEHTINNIIKKADILVGDINDKIELELDGLLPWKRSLKLQELKQKYNSVISVVNVDGFGISINKEDYNFLVDHKFRTYIKRYDESCRASKESPISSNFTPISDVIYINDVKTHLIARLNDNVSRKSYGNLVINATEQDDIDKIVEIFGMEDDDYVLVSTLFFKIPTPAHRSPRNTNIIPNTWLYVSSEFQRIEKSYDIDMKTANIVYVDLFRKRPVNPTWNISLDKVSSVIYDLNRESDTKTYIIGVNNNFNKKKHIGDNWIHIDDYIESLMNDLFEGDEFKKVLLYRRVYNKYNSYYYGHRENRYEKLKLMGKLKEICAIYPDDIHIKYILEHTSQSSNSASYNIHDDIESIINNTIGRYYMENYISDDDVDLIDYELNSFFDKHPMLKYVEIDNILSDNSVMNDIKKGNYKL